MRVKTWVETEQEVEVEVSIADMMNAITELEDGDQLPMVLGCISRCVSALRHITDERIAGMNDKQRRVVSDALATEARRFATDPTEAGTDLGPKSTAG